MTMTIKAFQYSNTFWCYCFLHSPFTIANNIPNIYHNPLTGPQHVFKSLVNKDIPVKSMLHLPDHNHCHAYQYFQVWNSLQQATNLLAHPQSHILIDLWSYMCCSHQFCVSICLWDVILEANDNLPFPDLVKNSSPLSTVVDSTRVYQQTL